jgi:hypothetical protein
MSTHLVSTHLISTQVTDPASNVLKAMYGSHASFSEGYRSLPWITFQGLSGGTMGNFSRAIWWYHG